MLLAAPCIAGFLLFYLVPLVGSIRYSWGENAFTQDFVGLKNFIETIQNRNFRLSVKNTLELIVMGVPLLVGSALMLAMLVKNVGDRHPVLRAALLLPMLVPSAAITSVFGELAADAPRVALLMIYVWKNSGFLMLIFLAAFSMVPREVYEAAALDGCGEVRKFVSITLPMIAGPFLFVVLLALSYNLRLFREAYLLYGEYPEASVYLTQHYMNNHFYKLNYQRLTTAATLFFAAVGGVVWLVLRALRKNSEEG